MAVIMWYPAKGCGGMLESGSRVSELSAELARLADLFALFNTVKWSERKDALTGETIVSTDCFHIFDKSDNLLGVCQIEY